MEQNLFLSIFFGKVAANSISSVIGRTKQIRTADLYHVKEVVTKIQVIDLIAFTRLFRRYFISLSLRKQIFHSHTQWRPVSQSLSKNNPEYSHGQRH